MTEHISTTVRGNGAPSVLVDGDIHASAGNPATMRVHVRNLADGPRDLSVTVIGLDDGWSPEPVVLRDVPADMTVSAEAGLVPAPGAVPGEYPFVVVVQALPPGGAQVQPTASVTTLVEAHVTVDAPSEVLLTVEPADSVMRLARTLDVVLSNTGNEPVEVSLSTRTEKGLRLQLKHSEVVVPARTTVRIDARARNLRPQLMGHLSRRSFSVAAAGKQAPARFSGTATARPLLSGGFMRVMSLLLVMALWAGGLVVGLPWLTDRLTTEQTTAEPSATPGTDPGAAVEPSAPAGGTDGDGGTDGPATETTDETVRIGGVVTATDPSGVTVQIAPASIIADAQGGGGAGGLSSSKPVPASAVLAARLAGSLAADKDSDAPLTKTSPQGVAIESTSSVATSRSTSTGDDGAWAFAGLSPNLNYLVTISKPGYQTVRHVVSGTEAAAGLDVDLLAGDGQLSGQVTGPDGAGAGGVDVVITDGTTTVTTSTTTTGAVGSWAVEGLSTPSTYLVTAQGNGLGAQSRLVTLSAGGSATADMALSDGTASLSGTVTGPDTLGFDSGVGGATVTASDGTTTRTASTVTSGLVGSYTLVDLPIPGSYEITVTADGYAPQTVQLTLDADSSSGRQDVALRTANGVVQGRITDTAGQALTSAGITLHNEANTYKTMVTGDGTFRLNGIAPGEYVVSATQFGHLTGYATVRASAGFSTIVDLVLTEVEGDGLVSTSRIRGRVGDARTNGQIDCTGLVAGEECLVTVKLKAQGTDGALREISVTSDPNAEYLIPGTGEEGLLPGLYVLEVSAPGYESTSIRVSVPMDTTVTAGQVALYPSPSLTGTVLARVGSVPEGTCVIVVPDGTAFPTAKCSETTVGTTATCVIDAPAQCGLTGVNGGYTITNIKSGSYQATVQSGDDEYVYTDEDTAISLVAGDVRRFDAVLHRLARISITASISVGASAFVPAAGATVTAMLVKPGSAPVEAGRATASDQGVVQLIALPAGAYRFDVVSSAATGGLQGKIEGITLGNNQELNSQIVLTSGAQRFQGRLVVELAAGVVEGVPDVPVTVTGITGYNGVVPVRTSVEVRTNGSGYFETQGTTPGADYLPVVADTVTVAFAGTGNYLPLTVQSVPVGNTATQVEVQPVGKPFLGSITLDGAVEDGSRPMASVSVEVLSLPPGSGSVSIAAVGTTDTAVEGKLIWSDMTQPPDTDQGEDARMARPGDYTIRVSAPGYAPVDQKFRILVGGKVRTGPAGTAVTDDLKIVLSKYGELRVAVYSNTCSANPDLGTCTKVSDPVITLRGLGAPRIGTAEPGKNYVDFGELPPGSYPVTVQAAGYATSGPELAVTVVAGQMTGTEQAPEEGTRVVGLQQLGVITGTVTTTIGTTTQPLAGALVVATSGTSSFSAVTDSLGTYRLVGTLTQSGLAAGDWTVTTTMAGYTRAPDPVTGLVNGEVRTLDIAMALTPVTFVVSVVESLDDAKPIPGLTVRLRNGGTPVDAVCEGGSSHPSCAGYDPGQYVFDDILPIQSLLQVTATAEHTGLTLLVNPVLGQDPWAVTVPLVSMSNTVRGVVMSQSGGGAPAPLAEALVTLRRGVDVVGAAVTTASDGAFSFDNLPDASYTVTSSRSGHADVTRTVPVLNGQVAVLDLIMFPVTRQVTVTVTSGSGSDLTGTLVGLSTTTAGANPASLAAQPLVRSTGDTYTTVFNQVPTGAWTATVTGAAGHPWTTSAVVADRGAASVQVPLTVTEVAITLSATAPAGADATMEATIAGTPTGTSTEPISPVVVPVPVGSGSRTVSLLAGSYTVTPDPSGAWTAAPAVLTVSADQREVAGSFVLALPPLTTTTSVTSPAGELQVGQTATLTATVRAGAAAVTRGEVVFTLGGQTLGPVAVTGGTATQAVTITRAMVAGSVSLTAGYRGAPATSSQAELSASQSPPVVLSVVLRPTTTSASASGGELKATFTATVAPDGGWTGPVAGKVTFAAGGEDCEAPVIAGTATCEVPLTAGTYTDFVAIFASSDGDVAGSRRAVAAFTVTDPPASTGP